MHIQAFHYRRTEGNLTEQHSSPPPTSLSVPASFLSNMIVEAAEASSDYSRFFCELIGQIRSRTALREALMEALSATDPSGVRDAYLLQTGIKPEISSAAAAEILGVTKKTLNRRYQEWALNRIQSDRTHIRFFRDEIIALKRRWQVVENYKE